MRKLNHHFIANLLLILVVNVVNRSRFGEVMEKSMVSCFFDSWGSFHRCLHVADVLYRYSLIARMYHDHVASLHCCTTDTQSGIEEEEEEEFIFRTKTKHKDE